jgi:hypothetical protein
VIAGESMSSETDVNGGLEETIQGGMTQQSSPVDDSATTPTSNKEANGHSTDNGDATDEHVADSSRHVEEETSSEAHVVERMSEEQVEPEAEQSSSVDNK